MNRAQKAATGASPDATPIWSCCAPASRKSPVAMPATKGRALRFTNSVALIAVASLGRNQILPRDHRQGAVKSSGETVCGVVGATLEAHRGQARIPHAPRTCHAADSGGRHARPHVGRRTAMMRSDRGRPWFWLGFAAGGIEISILFAMSFGKWKELPWPALALTGLLGPFGALTMFAATFVVPQWMPGSVEDPFAWWYWTLAWGVGAASNGLLYLGAARVALW